jgi:hypothetical protein
MFKIDAANDSSSFKGDAISGIIDLLEEDLRSTTLKVREDGYESLGAWRL